MCLLGLRICSEIDESQTAAKTTNLAPCAYQVFLKWDIFLYRKRPFVAFPCVLMPFFLLDKSLEKYEALINHMPHKPSTSRVWFQWTCENAYGYGRDKTRRINEIAQVTRDFVESRRLCKKCRVISEPVFINPRPLRPKGYCRHLRLSVCPSVCLSVPIILVNTITQSVYPISLPNLLGGFNMALSWMVL